MTELHLASKSGRIEEVTLLIKTGAEVNALDDCGRTSLYYACSCEYVDVVALLLHARASPDISNSGITVMDIACENKNGEIVKLLLKHRANINIRKNEEESFVHRIASFVDVETMKLAMELTGGYLTSKTKLGRTVLHYACINNNIHCQHPYPELIDFLIEKGCKVNEIDGLKQTPLHYVSMSGDMDIIKRLLSANTDADMLNSENKTALDLVKEGNKKALKKFEEDRNQRKVYLEKFGQKEYDIYYSMPSKYEKKFLNFEKSIEFLEKITKK